MTQQRHALLTGGKSGGHVFPALAVAEELSRRGWAVSYVGREDGMESRLARDRGLPFYSLDAKPLVGGSLLGKIRSLATLSLSALRAWGLVRKLDPNVVLGTGGFVSAPAVLGAWLARRPILLFEPNASVGVANRFLARFASGAAISFSSAGEQLRCPSRQTGVPVREAFFSVPSLAEAPREASAGLLVVGGSQGSAVINGALPRSLADLTRRAGPEDAPELRPIAVLHQCGAPHLEATRKAYCEAFSCADEKLEEVVRQRGIELEIVRFVDDMPKAVADCLLVISRAGAITLAEMCAAGRGAILIPLRLAGGHQAENAQAMVDEGAACLVEEAALEQGGLTEALRAILASPEQSSSMGQQAHRLSRRDSRERIADCLEELASGRDLSAFEVAA